MLPGLRGLLDGKTFGWSWSFGWTGYTNMMIRVQRQRKTVDAILGTLTIDGNPFTCYTLENLAHEIPAGRYCVEFTRSPEFNMVMPLIDVPGRTGIRIHPANYPCQLLGCIAVGDKEEPDAIDDSRITFNKLYALIRPVEDVYITITDIPEDPNGNETAVAV